MRRIISFLFLLTIVVSAQTNTFTNGNGTDIWNDADNWDLGLVPTAAHDVVIPADGYCVLSTNGLCKSLTVEANGFIVRQAVAPRYLTITGDVVCNGTIGDGTLGGSIAFNFNGTTTISGSGSFMAFLFRKSAGDNLSTLNINKNLSLLSTGNTIYNNVNGASSRFVVNISAGSTVTIPSGTVLLDGVAGVTGGGGAINVSGSLTLQTGNLSLFTDGTGGQNCTFAIASTGVVTAPSCVTTASTNQTHTLNIDGGGKLNITSGNLGVLSNTNNTYNLADGSIIEFSAAGTQTVNNIGAGYANLYLSGSGEKTLTAVTVSGTLKISGTATVAVSGGLTYGAASTLEYAGSSAQVTTANEFVDVKNLKISNLSGVALGGTSNISGTLTITGGAVFNTGNFDFTCAGVANNGTYSGNGTLTLTGGTMSGIGVYPNLVITGNVANAGAATISNSLTLTSNTLTNNSTLTFSNGATIYRTAGAFANTGTINYSGTVNVVYNSALTTGAELPASTTALSNLTVNAAVNLNSAVTVNGNLTLNGAFAIGTSTLTIKNPIQGTPTLLTSTANSGFQIAGTATGVIIPSTISDLGTLILNNVSGTTLQSNLTVHTALQLLNGSVSTSGYTLTWNGIAGNLTESSGKYVIGNLAVTKTVGAGQSNNFGGIGFALSAGADNLGNVTVTRVAGPGAAVNVAGNTGINRKWLFTAQNNHTANARTITLSWNSSDDNGKTISAVKVWRYDGLGWWSLTSDVLNGSSRTVTETLKENITGGSTTTLSITDNSSPLPVELVSFNASYLKGSVKLNWSTASEVENHGFEVEKRLADENSEWASLGFVEGNGNSNSQKEYSFVDNTSNSKGKYIYRLKQIDLDGTFAYSEEIEVDVNGMPTDYELSQNFPNPFNPSTSIRFSLPEASKVSLVVYNLLGEVVRVIEDGMLEAGYYTRNFDATGLTSGTYIYRLQTDNYEMTKKMMLIK